MKIERGVFGKYVISKADGSEIDPEASYFVLRLDTDEHAQKAMDAYAESVRAENPELADDIEGCLADIRRPACGCREAGCPHEPLLDRRWHHSTERKLS